MPFSKPLYFDNILHKKAGSSRKNITKYVTDTCNETNKPLLDVIDENKILDKPNHYLLSPRQIAEAPSSTIKNFTRNDYDYFVCRLSRPISTIFSDSNVKPFIISYRGRLCTGSSLTALDTKHEVNPHNPSHFSPYAYLETVILPSDDTTAGMLMFLTSNNSTPDLSTFGKLYATPISDRIHLPFEYSDETCSYERPTLCSCLIAEAVVLIRKKKPSHSIQVFHIKNNIISHRYTFDIPQKETSQTSEPTQDEVLSFFTHAARLNSELSTAGLRVALNQDDLLSFLAQNACDINTTPTN